jgi:predicted RNase H-like HicB family nuclease
MATKKDLKYYLKLKWSYTIEPESEGGKDYYIIRVNELPGVCTDAGTIEQGLKDIKEAIRAAIQLYLKNDEPIPEPIKKNAFKGNIAYRTTRERHYSVAKIAKKMHKSISKTLDVLIDTAINNMHLKPQ